MKKNQAIIIFISFLLTACASNSERSAKEKDSYEKVKETLEQKEKKNPVMFLSVVNHDKHNLIGQTVIKGKVTNNARVCSYKDVLLEVSFYSKTGTLLEKGNETVYDEIKPGRSADFKFKNFTPKGTDSVAIRVVEAKTNL